MVDGNNRALKRVEKVFMLSGVPEYTFVQPAEFTRLFVALRTPGRGLVIEGPSGIGKTTCVEQIVKMLEPTQKITTLHARSSKDIEYIEALNEIDNVGTVVIDDFHVLPKSTKQLIADLMKYLADKEHAKSKIVVIGINKVGDSLLRFEHDIGARIERIALATNPDNKVRELIEKGEKALNVKIGCKEKIIKESEGGFNIAQLLCRRICEHEDIIEEQEKECRLNTSIEVVREKVIQELSDSFYEAAKTFACGPRFIRGGRAPYLHLLRLLGESKEWSLQIDQVIIDHPEIKQCIKPLLKNNSLSKHIKKNAMINKIIHFDSYTNILSVENPKLIYFLKHLIWPKFAEKIGYPIFEQEIEYDFALSFAGSGRRVAEALYKEMEKSQLSVFYDNNEQHRILSKNIEDYLTPIYQSKARYIVPIINRAYPKSVWATFESKQFKDRFAGESVVPIFFSDFDKDVFSSASQVGSLTFYTDRPLDSQVRFIANTLQTMLFERKMEQKRLSEKAIPINELIEKSNKPAALLGKVVKIRKNRYGKILSIEGDNINLLDLKSNRKRKYLLSSIKESVK